MSLAGSKHTSTRRAASIHPLACLALAPPSSTRPAITTIALVSAQASSRNVAQGQEAVVHWHTDPLKM
jgi:hypothetical protein